MKTLSTVSFVGGLNICASSITSKFINLNLGLRFEFGHGQHHSDADTDLSMKLSNQRSAVTNVRYLLVPEVPAVSKGSRPVPNSRPIPARLFSGASPAFEIPSPMILTSDMNWNKF